MILFIRKKPDLCVLEVMTHIFRKSRFLKVNTIFFLTHLSWEMVFLMFVSFSQDELDVQKKAHLA